MKKSIVLLTFVAILVLLVGVGSASADSETREYVWLAGAGDTGIGLLCDFPPGCPDAATASNGDTIEIAGFGTLSVHPKSVTGSGSFKHIFAGGGSVSGTWEATELLSFKSYGPNTAMFPETWESGRATMRVNLFVSETQVGTAILQVGCLLGGPKEPGGLFEGSKLNVQGGPNFNKAAERSTLFIRQ